ncbi:MAG: T9SS type A sorting domain-containing protein, partial [Bacteroidia bacterium]
GFGRKIRVLMKGGFLDISKLSLDAQKHFELIYDEKPKSLEDNILILGNPFFETLTWQYIDDKAGEMHLNLMNIEGKIVQTYTFPTQKGVNVFELNTTALPAGFYFLIFENQTGNVIRRVWKGE